MEAEEEGMLERQKTEMRNSKRQKTKKLEKGKVWLLEGECGRNIV